MKYFLNEAVAKYNVQQLSVASASVNSNCSTVLMAILFNSFMYFPTLGPLLGPRPWHWLPICIYRPWPQLCIYLPSRQIFIYRPGQSRAWTCIYQRRPPNLYLLALVYDFYYRALNLYLPSYLQ